MILGDWLTLTYPYSLPGLTRVFMYDDQTSSRIIYCNLQQASSYIVFGIHCISTSIYHYYLLFYPSMQPWQSESEINSASLPLVAQQSGRQFRQPSTPKRKRFCVYLKSGYIVF